MPVRPRRSSPRRISGWKMTARADDEGHEPVREDPVDSGEIEREPEDDEDEDEAKGAPQEGDGARAAEQPEGGKDCGRDEQRRRSPRTNRTG